MSDRPERIDAFMQFTGAMVPEWLCVRPEVSAGAKLTYARLARFKGRKKCAYPDLIELGAEIGVGERQARRYTAELAKFDLIEIERVGLNEPNRYYFLKHRWMVEHPETGISGADTCDRSGADTDDRSGVDTSVRSGADTSDHSRADTSDRSLLTGGSHSGSQTPNPTPNPRAAGTNPRALGTNPRAVAAQLEDQVAAAQAVKRDRDMQLVAELDESASEMTDADRRAAKRRMAEIREARTTGRPIEDVPTLQEVL